MRTIALALLLVLCAGCGGDKTTATAAHAEFGTGVVAFTTQDADIGVDVEVATTEQQREQGLMNRTSLAENSGMYFVFPGEQTNVGFWMKDTLIPLSVAVADANGRISRILDMQPCEADPCEVYDVGPFVTALEANLGAFERWGVQVGDHMELQSP